MKPEDKKRFSVALEATMKAARSDLDQDVARLWWTLMQDMTIEQFVAACGQHLLVSKFAPAPAEIRDLAGVNKSAWPTPEEAWNLLPKTEADGGWMCQEIATAMGACIDSLDAGDRIGARMAFLEVYRREIKGKTGKPSWWLSEPADMGYEERAQWKADMLEHKPGRRPDLLPDAKGQVQAIVGAKRTGGGLVPVLGGVDSGRR